MGGCKWLKILFAACSPSLHTFSSGPKRNQKSRQKGGKAAGNQLFTSKSEAAHENANKVQHESKQQVSEEPQNMTSKKEKLEKDLKEARETMAASFSNNLGIIILTTAVILSIYFSKKRSDMRRLQEEVIQSEQLLRQLKSDNKRKLAKQQEMFHSALQAELTEQQSIEQLSKEMQIPVSSLEKALTVVKSRIENRIRSVSSSPSSSNGSQPSQ